MEAQELIDLIQAWLVEDRSDLVIEVLLTLPDVGWTDLSQMTERGDFLILKCRRSESGSPEMVLVCNRSALRAARRVALADQDP